MFYGGYPTPNDVKIFVKGTWVDDAYRIDLDKQSKKIPLTGYHQRKYKLVALGRQIVLGNIIIHFRFPGYLNFAIKRALQDRQDGLIHDASLFSPNQSGQSLIRPQGAAPAGAPVPPGETAPRACPCRTRAVSSRRSGP